MSSNQVAGDSSPPTRIRWTMLAWLCCGATAAYVQRQCLGTVAKPVYEQLGLSTTTMAHVLSAFFITYALFQIPAGWFAETFGSRRALAAMGAVWSTACGLIFLVEGLPGLLVCRLSMGVAQAGMFTCTTLSIRRWFPANRLGLANGLLAGFMQVGGFVGAVLAGWVTEQIGWRAMFLVFAAPGLAWALGFWWYFRDSPDEHAGVNSAERSLLPETRPESARSEASAIPWLALAAAWPLWCLAAQQFFRAGAQMFYGSWFSTYLQDARGQGLSKAGLLNGLPIASAALGPIVGGWLSDWLEAKTNDKRISRQGLAVACLLLCAGLMLLGFQIRNVELSVLVIGVGSFFAAAAGPAAYTVTIDLGGKRLGLVFAIMNMWGNIGAAAFPYLIPAVLGSSLIRQPTDPPLEWNLVFQVFALLYVLAAICWLPFNSTRPMFPEEST